MVAGGPLPHNPTSFVTQPGEKLIFATRKHWLILVRPLATVAFLASVFTGLSLFVFLNFFPNLALAVTTSLLILLIAAVVATKIIVDWHFNIYAVTTRKIRELRFIPLFSESTSEVILDQVRITEFDVSIPNMIHELMSTGDVILTFDHISHEEKLVFESVSNPKKIAALITDAFIQVRQPHTNAWISEVGTAAYIQSLENALAAAGVHNGSATPLNHEVFRESQKGGEAS